jgi:alanine racemase
LEGVCSHFADADSALSAFTEEQITRWNAAAEKFRQNFPEIKYYHLANTAGVRYAERTVANVGRLGLGLYGINPQPLAAVDLRPALEMKSVISAIKQVSAGAKIGYGITFEAVKSMRIATVPVGYNEGVDRRLSNRGYYKCRGRFCPLVGRVSMNISAIDVSDVPDVKMEDEVIIISRERTDRNSVENMARLCDCMPYEILVRIPQHLRRVVV